MLHTVKHTVTYVTAQHVLNSNNNNNNNKKKKKKKKKKKNEMGGACSSYEEGRVVYRVLVGKPEGKRPLGRSRRRWENNIWIELQEVGCGCVDWIGLAEDRDRWRALVSAVRNLRVP
jgi:hypothetical protein